MEKKTFIVLAMFSEFLSPEGFHGRVVESRVARFFLVKRTKMVVNIQNDHKIYQMSTKYINWP
jgi:hypothetical protein